MKTKSIMGAPALAEPHEIFFGQGDGAPELLARTVPLVRECYRSGNN